MAGKMNWARVRTEKRREIYGSEDAEGRSRIEGEKDKRSADEVHQGDEDPAGRAVSEYLRSLAQSDFLEERPPRIPKAVLARLKLHAAQDVAIAWLRRQKQYRWALRKVAEEAALKAEPDAIIAGDAAIAVANLAKR
jgi:hypothetical protein